jgi:DNA-binding transcriptional LysR family regulator
MTRFAGALDMFELPYDDKGFRLGMAWHPRNHADPAVSWLRDRGAPRAGLNGTRPAIPEAGHETKFHI